MREHCCSFIYLSVHDSSTSPWGDCVSQYERQAFSVNITLPTNDANIYLPCIFQSFLSVSL